MYNPPPADLNSREPLLYEAAETDVWYRSHQVIHHPLYFGRGMAQRWDDPEGQFGMLYLAGDPYGAFMESIGRGVLRSRLVLASELRRRGLSKIRFTKTLRLIDMVSSGGLTRLGTEGSLTSGVGYRNSQRWAQALYDHPLQPDGLYYLCRHDPARVSCALYERCEASVRVDGPCVPWAAQKTQLGRILDHYQFGTDL